MFFFFVFGHRGRVSPLFDEYARTKWFRPAQISPAAKCLYGAKAHRPEGRLEALLCPFEILEHRFWTLLPKKARRKSCLFVFLSWRQHKSPQTKLIAATCANTLKIPCPIDLNFIIVFFSSFYFFCNRPAISESRRSYLNFPYYNFVLNFHAFSLYYHIFPATDIRLLNSSVNTAFL